MGLGGERRDYEGLHLDRPDVGPDPIEQFRAWLAAAREAGIYEPEAMTVSTVDADGRPAARYVLLRGLDERGFCFYTNYRSAKGRALDAHPYAALTFGWLEIHRSVRVEGTVERLSEAESDAYFAARPRAARISAWASPQSEVIAVARRARARRRGRRAALRGRRGPPPAALGRLPRAPRARRALAGPRGPPARSPALRARRRRLAGRAAGAVGAYAAGGVAGAGAGAVTSVAEYARRAVLYRQ